jgi:hypothetical protein
MMETAKPRLIKVAPHGPTTSFNTYAIAGSGRLASFSLGMTPRERSEISM